MKEFDRSPDVFIGKLLEILVAAKFYTNDVLEKVCPLMRTVLTETRSCLQELINKRETDILWQGEEAYKTVQEAVARNVQLLEEIMKDFVPSGSVSNDVDDTGLLTSLTCDTPPKATIYLVVNESYYGGGKDIRAFRDVISANIYRREIALKTNQDHVVIQCEL